jgi:Spy/CpxP family protein refolding chaperone
MKTWTKIGIVGAAIAVALAAAARNPLKNPQMAKDLGLTQEQIQKLDDLRYRHQAERIDQRSELQKKMLDLQREMERDTPDTAVVNRLIDETALLRAAMGKARAAHLMDVRKVLTLEQWDKVKGQFAAGRGNRPGRGGRMGRGAGLRGQGPREGFGPGAPGCTGQGPGGGAVPAAGFGPGSPGCAGQGPGMWAFDPPDPGPSPEEEPDLLDPQP